jgi:predicted permease
VSSLAGDIRLGVRTLIKAPALTAVSLIALTIGIGLTTMMFSIVYGALMKGLPYPDGDRIVALSRANPERGIESQSIPVKDFADFRRQQTVFSELGGYTSGTLNVSGREKAERFSGSWVTANLIGMTGVKPMLGRAFLPGEDTPGGPHVALLGYAIWRDRYGADDAVVGRSIRVNGVPYEVIGVMPEGFRFSQDDALWLPWQVDPLTGKRGEGAFIDVVGNLKPGVTLDEASADLITISKRLASDYKESNEGFQAYAETFVDSQMGDEPKQLLYTMMGAVFFVLLIACSNVANLLLDRAAHRTREVGVRVALGATRAQIIRVFLAESFVLAAVGTVLGMVLAYVSVNVFNRSIADARPPFFIDIALHPPVLAFAVVMAVASTLFAGLIPAIQSTRSDIAEVLKDESRGSSGLRIGRMSRALVVFEIALSCGLLVAAGLMIKSVTKMRTMDTGFTSADVFTARVGFPAQYTDSAAQRQFFEQLRTRVGALPGVQAASISSGLPGAQQGPDGNRFTLDGAIYARETDLPDTRTLQVSTGFFSTLEIALRRGRLFTDADRSETLPVAIVNERFVRQYLDGGDALGRRVRLGGLESTAPWVTIVGVVGDVFGGDPEEPRPPIVFQPFAQNASNFAYIAARTTGAPLDLATPVREAVASLNPDLPIYWPMTLEKAIAEPLWFIRVFGTMFMIFGVVALFLAAIGLYAVMSFSVSRRAREVGIRIALGASSGNVVRLIFGQGAWQLGVGLGIGLLFAAAISRLMAVILFDMNPLDATVFGGVAAVLALTGTVACLVPAQRATRVDPTDAMRST